MRGPLARCRSVTKTVSESPFNRVARLAESLPVILGGIFDVLAKALEIIPTVTLPKVPRMAGFAKWGYAIAEALNTAGEEFLINYE